ncbi:MAG: type II toxin-antitoxin system prevent-host-death family antitoxin [Treponema sp.]|nr:type II toxin-antitoxin system prevent-host-death family antitoxin [Treponema sp.]
MYDNTVPVYEMKNKLSYYLHKVDEGEQVCISVRGKPAYVIQTVEEVEKQKAGIKQKKSLIEKMAELRKQYGLENDDFDFSEHLAEIRKSEALYIQNWWE